MAMDQLDCLILCKCIIIFNIPQRQQGVPMVSSCPQGGCVGMHVSSHSLLMLRVLGIATVLLTNLHQQIVVTHSHMFLHFK